MSQEADAYFSGLHSAVSAEQSSKWEAEITNAESKRLEEVELMDMMRAEQAPLQPAPAGTVEQLSASGAMAWIEMALSMEEKQYILSS